METIKGIFIFSIWWFIGVNVCYFVIYGDFSGFFTTIGFEDKLLSVAAWTTDKVLGFLR